MSQAFPLTQQQRRVWKTFEANPSVGRARLMVELQGDFETTALEAALDKTLQRHEILCTTFPVRGGLSIPLQVIDDPQTPPWTHHDLTDLTVDDGTLTALLESNVSGHFQPMTIRVSPNRGYLILDLNGMITDAVGLSLIYEEFCQFLAGEEPEEEEPLQYADYEAWQTELLEEESEELTEAKAFWTTQVAAAPVYAPPYGGKLAVGAGFASNWSVSRPVPTALAKDEALVTHCLTALALAARRLCDIPTPVVGYVPNGRKFEDMEAAAGPFSMALPLQIPDAEGHTFERLSSRIARLVEQADEHLEYFTPDHYPAQQIALPFGFEVIHLPQAHRVNDLELVPRALQTDTEAMQLKLVLTLEEHDARLDLAFNSEVLSANVADTFLGHLLRLLEAGVTRPQNRVDDLPLLDADEIRTWSQSFNGDLNPAGGIAILEAFQTHARQRPHAQALFGEGVVYDFAQVNTSANILARQLKPLLANVAEPVVAVAINREPAFVVALLAVWKTGAAYLPLQPDLPKKRRDLILEDAGAAAVLAVEQLDQENLILMDLNTLISHPDPGDPNRQYSLHQAAYVLFTSGSTGKPKGVVVEHAQVNAYTHGAVAKLGLERFEHFAMVSTVQADLGLTCLFPALLLGRELHMISQERTLNSAAFAQYMEAHKVDCLKITPSHLKALLGHATPAEILPKGMLVLGGEASDQELLDLVHQADPNLDIFNHYGPTETTVGVLAGPAKAAADGRISLGRPMHGAGIFLLDDFGRPTPPGLIGEITVSGPTVTRGYLNRPAVTAAVFTPHPLAGVLAPSGARIYHTGDLARIGDDHELVFLGRRDHQVKIRGFRVELDEVRAAVKRAPGVKDAAVLCPQGLLTAYIVANGRIDETEFHHFLAAELPEYMIPTSLVMLPALPLNPNGKLDLKALPDPSEVQPDHITPPRNDDERALCEVFSEVLARDEVGIHDNFFQYGGDSIKCILAVARAEIRGLRFTVAQMFDHQTPAMLAEIAEKIGQNDRQDDQALVELSQVQWDQLHADYPQLEDVYPLSPVQSGLLFHALYEKESRAYLEQKMVNFEGNLVVDAFKEAWAAVMKRHPALRTAFVWDGLENPLQLYQSEVVADLRLLDWRDREPEDQSFDALLQADREEGFNLNQAPLMRFTLIQLSDRKTRFLWTHHHLLLDGWSLPKILWDWLAAYEAKVKGQPLTSPQPPRYRDFIAWLGRQDQNTAERLWRQTLAGATRPTRLGNSQTLDLSGVYSYETLEIPAQQIDDLQDWARENGLTFNTLLQAAWALTLAVQTDSNDVVFGAPVSGRPASLAGVADMVGMFINTLPVRAVINHDVSTLDWLQQHQQAQIALREYEYTPLINIQKWSELPAGVPLFDHLLIFENLPDAEAALQNQITVDLKLEMVDFHALEKTNYVMIVKVMPVNGLNLEIMFDDGQVSAAVVRRLLRRLAYFLDAFPDQSQSRPAAVMDAVKKDETQRAAKARTKPKKRFKSKS